MGGRAPSRDDSRLSRLAWTPFWNWESSRFRAGWRILLAFMIFFAVYLGSRQAWDLLPLPEFGSRIGGYLLFFVAVGVVLLCSSRFLDRRPIRNYGFRFGERWWADFAAGIAIGVLLHGTVTGIHLGFGWSHVSEVASTGGFEVPLVAGLGIVLLQFAGVGLWEEVLFRGVFILNAAEGLSRWIESRSTRVVGAWLASTFVFGALHFFSAGGEGVPVNFVVISAVVAGLYFGLPYLWTGSLALPIGLHVATNFADAALFGGTAPAYEDFPALIRLTTSYPGMWEEVGGVALLAQVATLGILAAWVYWTRGNLSIDRSLLRAVSRESLTAKESGE